jgi:hypothetical protein
LVCLSLLQILSLFIPETLDLIDAALALLNFYIFLNFLFTARQIVKTGQSYDVFEALLKRKPGIYLEFFILLVFVGVLFFPVYIPGFIISFTPFDNELTKFMHYLNSLFVYKAAIFTWEAVFFYLFCCWVSHMLYFQKSTWDSIIAGSKMIFSVKSLFFIILFLYFVVSIVTIKIDNEFISSILFLCFNTLAFPLSIIVLFYHFHITESEAHNHSLQSDGAYSSVGFSEQSSKV